MFFGGQKQRRINSGCAAGHVIFDFGTILLNQPRGFPIKRTGGVVIEIMRQIGRNDDNRTGVGYIRFQNPRQFFGRNVAVNQRHDFEPAKNFLQKRQLHLQRMLVPMRRVVYPKTFMRRQSGRHFPVCTLPSGVLNSSADDAAMPLKATRCDGPTRMTFFILPA